MTRFSMLSTNGEDLGFVPGKKVVYIPTGATGTLTEWNDKAQCWHVDWDDETKTPQDRLFLICLAKDPL